jgi:hypothetical protein
MPKRTNDWQALIFFVKQFLSEDAEVTESRMLVDRSTGREAEVDVCIEGSVGGERVIVSVDALIAPAARMWAGLMRCTESMIRFPRIN